MLRFFTFVLALTAFPLSSFAEDFKGYPCTVDCSGHEAGYNWAEDKGITDPSDCGGNSNSFIEGCQSYAEEHQDALDDEDSASDFNNSAETETEDY